ncbi:MAG: MoaD/ThiS family protein [Flavobacterium sp.]|jgi:molybdopterin synthase sulfur carrier subunit|uniref:MoaD/ThiS family protein n=1 Tax=Flavobacterium sp. TaxID=239 RepID=UPI001B4AD877|nr:MoaD/ThiS family protein [Flavobacterium sp.]MBP6145710.1 MoaD/ThiS family protein [Flavobacterium sp.]MBP7181410.1 MoaD/ThiS family protein [Flavobacterium sp.]MBP7318887.1 MoaD/ThiS family protein [Flavobacterium sp.]MBP8886208.1 MoaD/ThiS family protein [Flavobacterium sp.]HRL70687.1 MoaD/ThiS family protein [Flavobacterium sp.]
MILNIKYFGVLAEITKKKEEQLVLEGSNMTVNSLKLKMESAYQELQKNNYSIAINQAMAGTDTTIKDQDVIAFLPPFAGG